MKKRLLSLLLALCMALSLVPVGAFAAYDTSNNITDITFSADGVPTKTSGTGWTYKNNTLKIQSGFSFANNANYPLIKCDVDKHVQPDGSRVTMWNLIPRKLIPPTRLVRYCCAELKEGGGKGRFIATGVRWAESAARRKNRAAPRGYAVAPAFASGWRD